jgi:hypothetical protein
VLTAAIAPTFTLSLSPSLTIAAGVLAVLDAAWRFRRPGGNALFTVLQVLLGLLVVVAAFTPVHPYVSTSIPARYLDTALGVVLLVQLLVRSARKGAVVWLTVVALIVTAAAVIVAFLKVT